jgi:hypothetical protein
VNARVSPSALVEWLAILRALGVKYNITWPDDLTEEVSVHVGSQHCPAAFRSYYFPVACDGRHEWKDVLDLPPAPFRISTGTQGAGSWDRGPLPTYVKCGVARTKPATLQVFKIRLLITTIVHYSFYTVTESKVEGPL